MALRAHANLPQMFFVGWDVVDTDQGPMLLEGNVVWGGNLAQMAGNAPLGVTGFPETYLHHRDRRRAATTEMTAGTFVRIPALQPLKLRRSISSVE